MNPVEPADTPKAGATAMTWRSAFDIVATGLMICASVAMLVFAWRTVGTPQRSVNGAKGDLVVPTRPLSLVGASVEGNASARVALVEFSDFQCPFCGKFAREILPALQRKYVQGGEVLIAFRNFPLEAHKMAAPAAVAAVCAGRQGEFWKAHDFIFASQADLSDRLIGVDLVSRLKLDASKFRSCSEADAPSIVAAEAAGGRELGISGTPAFFVGTMMSGDKVSVLSTIRGARSLDVFSQAIDEALRSGTGKANR